MHPDTRHENGIESHRAFDAGRAEVLHKPIDVSIQITSVCNLDCAVCSEHDRPWSERMGRGLRWMSPDLFARLERDILPYAIVLRIGISGEPSLSPHLGDFTRRAHALGCRVEVTTNGTRLDAPELALVLARCTSRLQVSVDAATASTYERLRHGARWDSLRSNLDLVAGERRGDGPKGRFVLSFMLLASNLEELPLFVDFAANFAADEVLAHAVVPVNAEGELERVDREPARLARAIEAAQRAADGHGIELTTLGVAREPVDGSKCEARSMIEAASSDSRSTSHDSPPSSARIVCHRPTAEITVLYDGRVFVCQHPLAYEKMQVGDLASSDVETIWNGALYRELRRALFTGDAPPICATCPIAAGGATPDAGFRAARAGPTLAGWHASRMRVE